MKTFLRVLALLLCVTSLDAATFKLDGELKWGITEPRCTFGLEGSLLNTSPAGSVSGTLKLVLWATAAPYPSPGYIVGEYTLGQMGGGYQYGTNFAWKSVSSVPSITGTFYFTIAVAEYTTAGWRNRLIFPAGTASIKNGDFVAQKKWTIPTTTVVAPRAALTNPNSFTLNTKATVLKNLLPTASRETSTLTISLPGFDGVNRLKHITPTGLKNATWQYQVANGTLNGKTVPLAKLAVTYSSSTRSDIVFYFHTASSGIYKTTDVTPSGKEIIWGSFTLQ